MYGHAKDLSGVTQAEKVYKLATHPKDFTLKDVAQMIDPIAYRATEATVEVAKWGVSQVGLKGCIEYYNDKGATDYYDYANHDTMARHLPWGDVNSEYLKSVRPQTDDWSCGLNSVARVFKYYGQGADMYSKLLDEVKNGYCRIKIVNVVIGAPPVYLASIMNRYYNNYKYLSGASTLMLYNLVKAGRPVIVLISVGSKYLHYVVVTNVNSDGSIEYVDTNGEVYTIPESIFVYQWELRNLESWLVPLLPVSVRNRSIIFNNDF